MSNNIPRYLKKYREEVIPSLMKELNLTSVMEVPRLEKIVINMGMGNVRDNPKLMESALKDLVLISGQKAVVTRAKKSISNFKIREGWEIGAKATVRGKRMYDFLDRFINIAVPRIRDFRGFQVRAFDGRGNFTTGIREQVIFPEIRYDETDHIRGMDITIVTTARTDQAGYTLLKAFGMPFRER